MAEKKKARKATPRAKLTAIRGKSPKSGGSSDKVTVSPPSVAGRKRATRSGTNVKKLATGEYRVGLPGGGTFKFDKKSQAERFAKLADTRSEFGKKEATSSKPVDQTRRMTTAGASARPSSFLGTAGVAKRKKASARASAKARGQSQARTPAAFRKPAR